MHTYSVAATLYILGITIPVDSIFKGLEFVNLFHPLGTLADLISRHALILLASVETAKDVVSGASLFVDGGWDIAAISGNSGRLPRLNTNRLFHGCTCVFQKCVTCYHYIYIYTYNCSTGGNQENGV